MAETTRSAPTPGGAFLPEQIIVWEILVRLPAKTLLRCRAVCRSFRRLTSTADFRLAHHRHQPCLPIVSRVDGGQHLHTFDFRAAAAAQLRPVAPLRHPSIQIRAACDGLLLLSLYDASFYICNPASRQWVLLPFVPHFLGFYPHRPSGEYRLLYGGGRRQEDPNSGEKFTYFVQAIGSRNRRCIGRPVASASKEELASVEEVLAKGVIKTELYHPSVLLRGNLHFYPVEHQGNSTDMVMVFSTTAELFRWMRAPAIPKSACLFEMDGKLALSSRGGGITELDIWVQQDYETELWEFKYHIVLTLAWEGFILTDFRHCVVMFLCEEGGVLVSNYKQLLHVDAEGKLLAKFHDFDQSMLIVPHRLKESLVHHTFFSKQQDEVNALLSPFI